MSKTDVREIPRIVDITEDETELIGKFRTLNARGKREATQRVDELASMNKFRKILLFVGKGNEKNNNPADCGVFAVRFIKR